MVAPRYPRPRGPFEKVLAFFRRTRRGSEPAPPRPTATAAPRSPQPVEPRSPGPSARVWTRFLPIASVRLPALRVPPAAWIVLGSLLLLAALQAVWSVSALSDRAVAASPEGKLPPQRDLEAKNRTLRKKIASFSPHGVHIVVDTGANRLYLKDGSKVLRDAIVSCGSGSILTDPAGGRTWMFDTPRGEFQVRSRQKDPNWIKPDWAFIEEGEPIPDAYNARVEPGMLGEYAMGIGGGYFIHGTLYTRMLGRNVTHGCVRVGDEDLEFVFNRSPMGTRVYIF